MVSAWPGVALTLAQIVAHQWSTVPKVAGNEVFSHFRAGEAANWSGAAAAVNGTITGATGSDHVPLPSPLIVKRRHRYEEAAAVEFPPFLLRNRKMPVYQK